MSGKWLQRRVKLYLPDVDNPHGYIHTGDIKTEPIFYYDQALKPYVVEQDSGWVIVYQRQQVQDPEPGEILLYKLRKWKPDQTRPRAIAWMRLTDRNKAVEDLQNFKMRTSQDASSQPSG